MEGRAGKECATEERDFKGRNSTDAIGGVSAGQKGKAAKADDKAQFQLAAGRTKPVHASVAVVALMALMYHPGAEDHTVCPRRPE